MFDLSIYKKRYFDVRLKSGMVLHIEPPTRKQLKNMILLTNGLEGELTDTTIDALYNAVSLAINKNKEKKVITEEEIEDMFDLSTLTDFIQEYFSWVAENVNQKN